MENAEAQRVSNTLVGKSERESKKKLEGGICIHSIYMHSFQPHMLADSSSFLSIHLNI